MLEVANLSVHYGLHRALDRVSLQVRPGELVVMLGANGAGKSTFLRAVAGQAATAQGSTILMEGIDITHRPPHRHRCTRVQRPQPGTVRLGIERCLDLDLPGRGLTGGWQLAAGGQQEQAEKRWNAAGERTRLGRERHVPAL